MPSASHHRFRAVATAGAAVAHGYLAVLGAIGYLNYTVPTRYVLLSEIADGWLWVWIHGLAAVLLVLALVWPYVRVRGLVTPAATAACSLGFAAMLTWSFFNLLWGLSTVRPVSLAGPGLALVVAFGEQLLAHAWYRGATTRDR